MVVVRERLNAASSAMDPPRSASDLAGGLAAGLLFALSVTSVRKGEATSGLAQTLVAFAAAALLSLLMLPATPLPGAPSWRLVAKGRLVTPTGFF